MSKRKDGADELSPELKSLENLVSNIAQEIIETLESLPSQINQIAMFNPGFYDCPRCGKPNGDIIGATYCPHCGKKVLDKPFTYKLRACTQCEVNDMSPIIFHDRLNYCCYCGGPLTILSEEMSKEIYEALPGDIDIIAFMTEGVLVSELFSDDLFERIVDFKLECGERDYVSPDDKFSS